MAVAARVFSPLKLITMDSHEAAVSAVAAQIEQFYHRQQPFRIYHGSTNSTRQSQHSAANTISTAHLTRVLEVNRDAKTAVVEPNVPMDALVHATLPHGLVPLVVMEFPGITAGGGFSGTSGESSSFRHGFFDATVNWIEIVLPNGEVRRASPTTDADLFWGAASSFGTLGVVTLVEVQCREAKPYVELRYLAAPSMDAAMDLFRAETADPSTEYLDGIVFARDHVVVCAGRLVDTASGGTIQRFTRPHDPWFYLQAQRRAPVPKPTDSTTPTPVDYIPLEDYLFRYDRGAFWTGRYAYSYFITPFNRITRYILDYFMHTRVMYHALHKSGLSDQFIIQDVAVPYHATDEFVTWLDNKDTFGAYPIWLCPLNHTRGVMAPSSHAPQSQSQPTDATANSDGNYLMNFGLWAPSRHARNTPGFVAQNRHLEEKVRSLGGKKWLYAHAYYTESEFWSIYDKPGYDALRAKYHASYLPDLYQKVRVDLRDDGRGGLRIAGGGKRRTGVLGWVKNMLWGVWPVSGLYGVYRAWRGGEYLLKRD